MYPKTLMFNRRQLLGAGAAALALTGSPGGARAADPVPKLAQPPAAMSLRFAGYLEAGGHPVRIADALCEFKPAGDRYTLLMRVASPFASLSYESEGLLDEYGLHPRLYREVRKLPLRGPRERSVAYYEGNPPAEPPADAVPRVALPAGGQDRLSVLIQMPLLARARPDRIVPGSRWRVAFASFDHVDEVQLAVGNTEEVVLGSQRVRAQRVRRTESVAGTPDIDFWMADDAERAPVVIRFEDDGRALRFERTG
jgi:hypothetical protein